MELDEVLQRVLRRYGGYLALAVLLPVLVALLLVGRQSPTYVASSRIQLTATTPDTATAADAVVSQAAAAVTSVSSVRKAVDAAGVRRDIDAMIKNDITVTGLGTSSTIDIAVTDSDPRAAQRIAAAMASDLVSSTNARRLGTLPDVLASIDTQLTQLATKRAPLAAEAQARPADAVAQNRLAGIDRLISDLSGDRNRLALEAAAGGHATILDQAIVPANAEPSQLPQILALVAMCGLALGLLVVALLETLRPHVSGANRIARMLRSPALGRVIAGRRTLWVEPGLAQRARLAAYRADSAIVVVVPVGRPTHLTDLVSRLDEELAGRRGRAALALALGTDPAGTGPQDATGSARMTGPEAATAGVVIAGGQPDVLIVVPEPGPPSAAAPGLTDPGLNVPGLNVPGPSVPGPNIPGPVGDGERVAVAALAGANGNGSGNGAAKLLGLLTSDQPAAGRGPRLRVGHALSRSGNLGTWTGEGPTLLSAFTGGADGADGAGDGGSPVPGPDGGEPPADGSGGQPSAASAGVQAVRNLADLDPTEERQRVGVIVVTPPMAPRVSLEQIEDLLQLSGWPLLGVVTVRPSRRFWER